MFIVNGPAAKPGTAVGMAWQQSQEGWAGFGLVRRKVSCLSCREPDFFMACIAMSSVMPGQ